MSSYALNYFNSNHYHSRNWLKLLSLLLVMMFSFTTYSSPTTAATRSKKIQAVFVLNFMIYTKWKTDLADGLNLCLIGDVSFSDASDMINGRTVNGRLLNVKKIKGILKVSLSAVQDCHAIFIANSYPKQDLDDLLKSLSKKSILTISERKSFIDDGGMINLIVVNKKQKFEINKSSADVAGISFSSKLLQLSHKLIE